MAMLRGLNRARTPSSRCSGVMFGIVSSLERVVLRRAERCQEQYLTLTLVVPAEPTGRREAPPDDRLRERRDPCIRKSMRRDGSQLSLWRSAGTTRVREADRV